MAETWVINESPNLMFRTTLEEIISFVSNGLSFNQITIGDRQDGNIMYNAQQVYDYGWSNTAYRTVTFDTAPTGDLLAWLQANAVKQQEPSNTIKIGSSDVNIMIGNTQVDKVYIGSNVVWEKAEPTPTGYNVTIGVYGSANQQTNNAGYSFDNGSTWIYIEPTYIDPHIVELTNVTQIKLRAKGGSRADIRIPSLGIDTFGNPAISDNIVLTGDVSDVTLLGNFE